MEIRKVATANDYYDPKGHPFWREEYLVLRKLLLSTELEETIKWNIPVYCLKGKNVVALAGFKMKYGLWFYQGSFLSDPHKILVNAQAGKTKGMRHLYLQDVKEIDTQLVMSYLEEAIDNQKKGLSIKPERKKVVMAPELKVHLDGDGRLREAFEALSSAKQGDYAEYINEAKRLSTKEKRLAKILPMIKEGLPLSALWSK